MRRAILAVLAVAFIVVCAGVIYAHFAEYIDMGPNYEKTYEGHVVYLGTLNPGHVVKPANVGSPHAPDILQVETKDKGKMDFFLYDNTHFHPSKVAVRAGSHVVVTTDDHEHVKKVDVLSYPECLARCGGKK